MVIPIKIKKLHPDAIIPHYVHDGDAGMDVYSVKDMIIKPGERILVPTGISFEIPKGFEIQVRPKSGLALKYGLTLPNSPGTLDSGYRGELGVIMLNTSNAYYDVRKGEKIAQIILTSYEEAQIEEVTDLSETSRGAGGFGSTGLQFSNNNNNNSDDVENTQ
ncbi:dUTP diphosphatase [Candidatus Pacearchaeota archaeon]|nr:dUTP diphosphatase [Candidatus Pacearchaeota archaeon]